MAVVNCIGHIAEQSYEAAEELILCFEGSVYANSAAASQREEQRLKSEQPADLKRHTRVLKQRVGFGQFGSYQVILAAQVGRDGFSLPACGGMK